MWEFILSNPMTLQNAAEADVGYSYPLLLSRIAKKEKISST